MLSVHFLPPAEKYFKKLKDQQLKHKYREAIIEIRKELLVGEAKKGDLAGILGYDIYRHR